MYIGASALTCIVGRVSSPLSVSQKYAVAAHDAGVVDEHVGVADVLAHLLRGLRDGAEVADVDDERRDAGAALRDRAERVDGARERRGVAIPERDGCRVLGHRAFGVHAAPCHRPHP